MIYVLTEDSKDGFYLCNKVCEVYNHNAVIESYDGIVNLRKFLTTFCRRLDDTDIVILTYDRVFNNPLVYRYYYEADDYLVNSGKEHQFKKMPILSFEFEILMIRGIEYFANISNYIMYVSNIRDLFHREYSNGHTDELLRKITSYTKSNSIYDGMYNSLRIKMKKKKNYIGLPDKAFETCVTIESLSKKLINKVFEGSCIQRPMQNCWMCACCYRKRRCNPSIIDIDKITAAQTQNNDDYVKANFLISNTSYRKLAEILSNEKEIIQYRIEDFIKDSIFITPYMQRLLETNDIEY